MLLAIGLAACGDVEQNPTGPIASETPRTVKIHTSKGASPSDTVMPPATPELCSSALVWVVTGADEGYWAIEVTCDGGGGDGGGGGGGGCAIPAR